MDYCSPIMLIKQKSGSETLLAPNWKIVVFISSSNKGVNKVWLSSGETKEDIKVRIWSQPHKGLARYRSWKKFWIRKWISKSCSTQLLEANWRWSIWFHYHCRIVDRWKNYIFQSPSYNHYTRDLCCQCASSCYQRSWS